MRSASEAVPVPTLAPAREAQVQAPRIELGTDSFPAKALANVRGFPGATCALQRRAVAWLVGQSPPMPNVVRYPTS